MRPGQHYGFRAHEPYDPAVLAQTVFLHGDAERVEVAWFQPDGRLMDEHLWEQNHLQVIGLYIDRSSRETGDERDGERPLFLVLNAGEALDFTLPAHMGVRRWRRAMDTSDADAFASEGAGQNQVFVAGEAVRISGGSVCAFARVDHRKDV